MRHITDAVVHGRALRIALAMAGALVVVVVSAQPASAQVDPPCTATLNFIDANSAQSPATAIEVDAGSKAVVDGIDPNGAGTTEIAIEFEPFPPFPVVEEEETDVFWGGTVNVDDYATYGVGLYRVTGSTDNCDGAGWVRVVGKSPFTTVAGIVAAILILTGLLASVPNILRAHSAPGVGPVLRAALRAIPLGLGALILAQQFGVFPITGATIAAWLVAAMATVGLLHLIVAAVRGPKVSSA